MLNDYAAPVLKSKVQGNKKWNILFQFYKLQIKL